MHLQLTILHLFFLTEVANDENYNESCDVYSFGILFWQMLSMKTPFEVYTMKVLEKRVWNGEHKRPFIDVSWSDSIKELLEISWHKDTAKRPSFQLITDRLRKECIKARGGDEEGLEHSRRRSTFVFDKGDQNKMMKMSSVSDFMSSKNLNENESGVNKTSRPVLSGIMEGEEQ
ncbi:MAG: serine/threonine protein kinase [Bacillariaceae sp.]